MIPASRATKPEWDEFFLRSYRVVFRPASPARNKHGALETLARRVCCAFKSTHTVKLKFMIKHFLTFKQFYLRAFRCVMCTVSICSVF